MSDEVFEKFGQRLTVKNIHRTPSGHYEADIDVDKELYEQLREHVHASNSDAGDDDVNVFLEQCVAHALQEAARKVGEKKQE